MQLRPRVDIALVLAKKGHTVNHPQKSIIFIKLNEQYCIYVYTIIIQDELT